MSIQAQWRVIASDRQVSAHRQTVAWAMVRAIGATGDVAWVVDCMCAYEAKAMKRARKFREAQDWQWAADETRNMLAAQKRHGG